MKRRKFDQEFKQMTVELSRTRQDIPVLAKELDIRADLIYRWRREAEEHSEGSFPGNGHQITTEDVSFTRKPYHYFIPIKECNMPATNSPDCSRITSWLKDP